MLSDRLDGLAFRPIHLLAMAGTLLFEVIPCDGTSFGIVLLSAQVKDRACWAGDSPIDSDNALLSLFPLAVSPLLLVTEGQKLTSGPGITIL